MSVQVELCQRIGTAYSLGGGRAVPAYHVCLAGDTRIWECAPNSEEALVRLAEAHPEQFPRGRAEMEVRYLGLLAR